MSGGVATLITVCTIMSKHAGVEPELPHDDAGAFSPLSS